MKKLVVLICIVMSFSDLCFAYSKTEVIKWYNQQKAGVQYSLIDMVKQNVAGVSNITVTQNKFLFGESNGYYDCHYTLCFDCYVDGVSCMGEGRAFLKYMDTNLVWWNLKVYPYTATGQYIYRTYDDSYEDVIENYYKELQKKF